LLRVAGEANVSPLEAAMLGLLALMISFTLAMALARFDAGRDADVSAGLLAGWHSPSSRRSCAPQPRELSLICGTPSASPSTPSRQASAKIISPPQDTTQRDRKML